MNAYARSIRPSFVGARPNAIAAAFGGKAAVIVPACLLATLAFLVVSYLALMNAMTQKAFEIKTLQGTVDRLRHDEKRAEVDLAEKESMANLADKVASLGMVPTGKLEYLTAVAGAVALR